MRGQPAASECSAYNAVFYRKESTLPRGTLRECLNNSRVDQLSGIPVGGGSLALRYILPVYDLEKNVPADSGNLQLKSEAKLHEKTTDSQNFAVHVTGSSREKLDVPPFTIRDPNSKEKDSAAFETNEAAATASCTQLGKQVSSSNTCEAVVATASDAPALSGTARDGKADGGAPFYTVADTDVMVEIKKLPVALQQESGRLYMEEGTASHIGYTRIRVDVPDLRTLTEKDPALARCIKFVDIEGGSTVSYLSVDGVNDRLVENAQPMLKDATVERHGPAVNIQENQLNTHATAFRFIEDFDFVPALPLLQRPLAMAAWVDRVSAEGIVWPDQSTREDIRDNGRCFLVGAGHSSAARRDLEWRISFSDPERRLAVSLSPNQRKVYKVIKLLQKCFLKELKVLVTYHLKTLMFWELESCGIVEWTEANLFQHILNMLDRIEHCLQGQNIPSYFVPENNLISHARPADVVQTLAAVRRIRRQPLQFVYLIDETLRFDFSSLQPLSELHRPLRQAVLAGDMAAAPEALVLSLLRQLQSDLHRGIVVSERCVDLLHDAWEALMPEGGGQHPVHDDWIAFAAAAALPSMELDESAWAIKALELALADEERSPPPAKQLNETEQMALTMMMEKMGLREEEAGAAGGLSAAVAPLLKSAQESGQLQMCSTLEQLLPVRHAQLELLRDIKNKQEEGVHGTPPLLNAAQNAMVQIQMADIKRKFQIACGTDEAQANMATVLELSGRINELVTPQQNIAETVLKSVRDMIPIDILSNYGDLSLDQLSSTLSDMDTVMKVASEQPHRLSFVQDPRVVGLIPQYMLAMYIHQLGAGMTVEAVDVHYTANFNMIGFFLKQQQYLPACRMLGRMCCVGVTMLDVERKILYDLGRARLYLQHIPAAARRLLSLTSHRAVIGVVYRFIDFINVLYDQQLMLSSFLTLPGDLHKVEALAAGLTGAPEDVRLTQLVMVLTMRHIVGWSTQQGLQDIETLAGSDVARQVKDILGGWAVPAIEPTQ